MELPEIPGYKYVRKIGEGGFCEVYLAEHETLGLPKLAVKIPKTEEYPIEYEACVLHRLRGLGIKGIIPYYGLHQKKSSPALILGYGGETLEDALKDFFGYMERSYHSLFQESFFSEKDLVSMLLQESLDIFLDLAETIKNINSSELVHGDIKPSNILLSREKIFNSKAKVTLCDFGFSTIIWEKEPPLFIPYFGDLLTKYMSSKNKYSYSFEKTNTHLSYMTISLHTNTLADKSLLFSKSVLEKSIALRGGTPSYQAPESLQGKFSGMEDCYALARILEEILKVNKHSIINLFEDKLVEMGTPVENKNKRSIDESTLFLDKQIHYVQKNFLCYNPFERPSPQTMMKFVQEIRKGIKI